MIGKYPCQSLLGGTGEAIYHNVDGMCDHPECNPLNDDRVSSVKVEAEVVVKLAEEMTPQYIDEAFNKIVNVTQSNDLFERDGFGEGYKLQLQAIIMQIWLHSKFTA